MKRENAMTRPIPLLSTLFAMMVALVASAEAPAPATEAELLEKYRAATDAELKDALNDVSHRMISALQTARDDDKELAYVVRNGEHHSEEIDAARARVAALREELAVAEAELRDAILALPEMKEKAEKVNEGKAAAEALRLERQVIRKVMAERRPNPGPRPAAEQEAEGNPLVP